jgi:Transposase IS66 family
MHAGPGSGVHLKYVAELRRCFDYAEVELSNNLAENSMRPVALGRKNWLHVGSGESAPKVAAILSVIESCRRLGIPVKEYLLAVLPAALESMRGRFDEMYAKAGQPSIARRGVRGSTRCTLARAAVCAPHAGAFRPGA